MTIQIFFLALISVAISSLAQISLKHGMASVSVQAALKIGVIESFTAIGTNLFVIGGLVLYGLGAMVWLGVLARVDVSIAYPFVAMGFVITMILAGFVLGENINTVRLLGTLLIATGAILVARS